MYDKIDVKTVYKNTSAYWTTLNPVSSIGIIYYEVDTNKIKLSDGLTRYNDLPYVNGDSVAGGNIDMSNVMNEINNIKTDLVNLHNDFDAIDLGEMNNKAENDEVVHSKGVSGVETVNGPKTFMDTILLEGNSVNVGDITNTAATTKFVTDSINELKNNLPSAENVTTKIVEHNLSNQSHNDIRNLVKDNTDAIVLKADTDVVNKIQADLETTMEDVDFLQTDIANFINVTNDAALKSKDNTYTGKNVFQGDVAFSGVQVHLTNGAVIKDGANDKNIINLIEIDDNTQQLYIGNDELWLKGTDKILLEGADIKTKRMKADSTWEEYTNIDSGNISEYVSGGSVISSDKYGIEADYAVHHGIIECPNGLIEYNATNKNIVIKSGLVLQTAGNTSKTTLTADIPYTILSTGKITLFYAQGLILEAGDVFYQEEEPDNGVSNYLAWYKPSLGKWQFKSNSTGNVFREALATPIANVNAGETLITSINYIGYRIIDDDCFASVSDVESLTEIVDTVSTTVNGLANTEIFTTNKPTMADLPADTDLSTLVSSFNTLLGHLRTRGIIQ